ncbi:MAG: carbon storage regulator CsrA [Deltaproteobacteria bacterium]|nr:carbon storage regulator CsrA [Deltaproteobacteria bacterium]
MLVLTRKLGQDIFLNDEIRIVVKEIKGKQVRIGIEAPAFVSVYRGEIYRQIQEENRRASAMNLEEARDMAEFLNRKEKPE